ncbi:MAG: hypothetical protein WAT39_23855 [Planctomycetota bacterium]
MSRILAIDPGATTGWCLYVDDDLGRYVQACGSFREDAFFDIPATIFGQCDAAVIERPVAHGPTYPQVVECAWVAGCLWRDMLHVIGREKIHLLTRLQVRQTLTEATHGIVRVKNDATAWAALVLLHGDDSDRKPKTKKGKVVDAGGPLGSVKAHERAALAVAVAFALRAAVTAGDRT